MPGTSSGAVLPCLLAVMWMFQSIANVSGTELSNTFPSTSSGGLFPRLSGEQRGIQAAHTGTYLKPNVMWMFQVLNEVTRCLVLALGVCYHACLENREEYRLHIQGHFVKPLRLPGGAETIFQEINRSNIMTKSNHHINNITWYFFYKTTNMNPCLPLRLL